MNKIILVAKIFLVVSALNILLSIFMIGFNLKELFQDYTGYANQIQLLVISLLIFISSLGMIRKKNWSRISFIFTLILISIWSIFSTYSIFTGEVIKFNMISVEPTRIEIIIKSLSLLTSFAFVIVFGWIIKVLLSEEVKRQFTDR